MAKVRHQSNNNNLPEAGRSPLAGEPNPSTCRKRVGACLQANQTQSNANKHPTAVHQITCTKWGMMIKNFTMSNVYPM